MIIVGIIKLTINIVVIVVVVLITILKIIKIRVKNLYYIIRLNTNNPIQMSTRE